MRVAIDGAALVQLLEHVGHARGRGRRFILFQSVQARRGHTRYAGLECAPRVTGAHAAAGIAARGTLDWRKTAQQTLEVYYEVVEQCQAVTAGVVSAPISQA